MPTTTNWGRLAVLVDGVDRTFFRNVPVVIEHYDFAEPFDDATCVLRWPQITQFEYPGITTAISWLMPWSNIDIVKVDPGGVITTVWQGMISEFEDDWNDKRGHLLTTCFGANHQLSLYNRAPTISDAKIDIGQAIADQYRHYFNNGGVNYPVRPALRMQPMAPVVTGLATRFRGDWSDVISFIQSTLDKYGMDLSDPVNILTANQASGEAGNTTGYHTNNANTTLTNSTAQAADGTHSFAMTSVAAGDMIIASDDGSGSGGTKNSFVVNGGGTYTFMASFRAATVARSCEIVAAWYDNTGTAITSAPADVTAGPVINSTTGWTQVSRALLAPPNAVTGSFQLVVLATGAANEVHYVDKIGVRVGNNANWAIPDASPLTATQWTVKLGPNRTPYMMKKDRKTVNWTVSAGSRGMTLSLRRDLIQERNVIYGDAQDLQGAQWTNSFPNGLDVFYQPLAYDTNVHTIDIDAHGNLVNVARGNTATIRNETHVSFGQGVKFSDGVTAAQQMFLRDTSGENWVGTITLKIDPQEGSRMDIRAGHNILIANYRGLTPGLLLHITAAEFTIGQDGAPKVRLTVDSKARDLPTVAAILQRNREVNRSPMYPLSGKVDANLVYARASIWDTSAGSGTFPNAPDVAPNKGTDYSFYTGAAANNLVGSGRRCIDGTSAVTCPVNQWSIIKFRCSERDQIVRTRIYSSPATAFSAAIFNYPPIGGVLIDPRAARSYEVLAPPKMIIAWGASTVGPDNTTVVHNYAGYSPGNQVSGDAITGVLDDSAPWNYSHDDDTETALQKNLGPVLCSINKTVLTYSTGAFDSTWIGTNVVTAPGILPYGTVISSINSATSVNLSTPCTAPGGVASNVAVTFTSVVELGIHSPYLWIAIYPITQTANFYGVLSRGPYQAS